MDEFIDVILIILLVLIVGWLGLTTYLLLRYPMAGYRSIFALLALIGGGVWYDGVRCGSRAVSCGCYPWYVGTYVGVWCVCDSL